MNQDFEYNDTLDAAANLAAQAAEEVVDVERYFLDFTKPIARPTAVISDPTNPNRIIVSEQNILTIVGEAKSYKSFLASLLTIDYFKQNRDSQAILIDTEQAEWNVQNVAKRVCDGMGWDYEQAYNKRQLKIAHLRPYTVAERIQAIEAILAKYKPYFCLIDGIRDLVQSINDDVECSAIVNRLMVWTEQYNCAIATVLHTNKDGETPRGHIGSELLNKSETILMCKAKDGGGARVKSFKSRNQSIDAFDFELDDKYVPHRITNGDSMEELAIGTAKEQTALKALQPKVARPLAEWLADIRVAAMCSEPTAKKYFEDFVQFGVLISANREATFFTHYKAVGDTPTPQVVEDTQTEMNVAQIEENEQTQDPF